MKATLGLCVVALAATICSGYIPGNEYHYHTEGQLVHEMDKKSHQHAGFLAKVDVIVQVKENIALLKFQNVQVASVNEKVSGNHEHHFVLVPPALSKHFEAPVQINYKNGLLTDIQVSKDEPFWSVNLKKAVASRFQLNFNHANVVHDSHNHQNHSRFDTDHYYHAMEDGLIGECEVAYEVDDTHHNTIHVTKTKNVQNCKNLNYQIFKNDDSVNCYDCGTDIHTPIQLSDITHYELQGDRKNYVVQKMNFEERWSYFPFGRLGEYIKGDSKLSLELVDVKKATEELQVPNDAVTHNDLHFQFEEHFEIKNVDDLKKANNNFLNFVTKPPLEKVYQAFDDIVNIDDGKPYTEAFKTKSVLVLFKRFDMMMKIMSYDELEQMYTNHVIQGITDQHLLLDRKKLFGDLLVQSGTGASFMFLKHAITELGVTSIAASRLITELQSTLNEFSPVLLEEFYTLCEHPTVHNEPSVRRACYLSFSNFVYEQCVKKDHGMQKKYPRTNNNDCTSETADKYFEKMVKSHEGHAKNSMAKIMCIKTAGNFGTLKSMEYLRKIIHDTHLHPYYRFSAIWALWHNTETHPKEVQSLLTPVYFNTSESHDIRSIAVYLILFSNPQLHQIQTIADSLLDEDDYQVKHYVLSTIKQISQAHHPCFRPVIAMCKKVLRYFERIPQVKEHHDFRQSFTKWTDGFDTKWKMGGGTYFTYINSNNSYFPRHIDVFVEDYVKRSSITPFKFGYTGYGLDKFADLLFEFAKPKKSANVGDELKNINEQLHIAPREHEKLLGDFHLNIYGSEILFMHFNDATFETGKEDASKKLPELMNALKDYGKHADKQFHIGKSFKFIAPSAVGWPIFIETADIGFTYAKLNNLKLNVNEPPQTSPPTVSVKLDAHLIFDSMSSISSGAIGAMLHTVTGAGIVDRQYLSLPLKLEMIVHPSVATSVPKVVLKYTPIVPHTRFIRTFTPYTALLNMSNYDGDVLKDGTVLPYSAPNELDQVEKDLFHDYLGYGIHFKGAISKNRQLDSWGSFWKFLVETNTREKFYYLETNPKATMLHYEISLTPASKDPTTEIDLELSFDHFGFNIPGNKVYKPDFPTVQDGHADYINSRNDRKAATCVLKAEKVSKGSKERKLVTELAYTYTLDNLYHKLDFSYDRAPYSNSEVDHFKICSSSSILFPQIDTKKVYELQTADMDPKIQVAADIHFGKNCENDKKVTVRGELSRTEEHQHMQADRENAVPNDKHENYDAVLYNLCKKDNAKGIHYSGKCKAYYYRALKLRHYSIDIEHENLNQKDRICLSKLDNFVKLGLMYYLNDYPNTVANDSNKIHVEAEFSAKTDHVDLKIRKPHETSVFTNVPHPDWIQARSATPFFEFTNKMVKSSHYKFPNCAVEGNHVKTFDNVHYELPPAECYKLLAKDCSKKELFAVLGKEVDHNHHSKAVKILLTNVKIEAVPDSDGSHIAIKVNDEPISVTEAEPFLKYEKQRGKNVLWLQISFNGVQYKFKSMHNHGVTVYYDGKSIVTYLSPYYRGKQCGLCGDFNNNPVDEFLGPQNCVFQNSTDFIYSYTLGGNTCKVPELSVPCIPHPSYDL